MLTERLVLFCINLFCPPVTVLILTGPSTDALINTCLFIAGVIPGHIHGFYLSCMYFHRKGKVRKGKWPGGKVRGIFSKIVWNGGASDETVEELYMKEMREKERTRSVRRSRRVTGGGGIGREMSGVGSGKSRGLRDKLADMV